MTTMWSD